MSGRKLLAAVVISIYSCALASGADCIRRPDSEKYTCWVVVIYATSGEFYIGPKYPQCSGIGTPNYSDLPCRDVHVGAEVTVQCQSDHVQLFFKDEPLGTGHSATFSPVGYEQSGHYDCRNASGAIVYERTMSVRGDAVVFPDNCYDYSARSKERCYHPSGIFFDPEDEIQFKALGEEPLVISYEFIEWINHIPVQLNPTLEREGHLYTLKRTEESSWPVRINGRIPRATLRIEASNNMSNSSAFYETTFLDAGLLALNIRLEDISNPEVVVREGQEVNFTCGFDIEDIGNYTTVMSIEKPPGNVLEKCLISVGSEETDCGDDPLITTTVTRSLTDIYYYSMIVNETSRLYGGAALRCNVSYKSQLQWMSEANLTVTVENGTIPGVTPPSSSSPHLPSSSSSTLLMPRSSGAPPPTPTMDESTDDLILYAVMAILATLLILGLGVATAVVVCHFYCKKKSHSEAATILELEPTLAQQQQLLPLKATQSADSGLDFSHDVYANPVVITDASTNNLAGRRTQSLKNISMMHQDNTSVMPCVYVSCSDDKVDWVFQYLKPIILKMANMDVKVSKDMVPGQPISEERLRLIHEAQKIVIVCSPLYLNSPWSQYDLYQSVSKQASVVAGKIIPILCDGVDAVPSVLKHAIGLRVNDIHFERKLNEYLLAQ